MIATMQIKFSNFMNKHDTKLQGGAVLRAGAIWEVVGINDEGKVIGQFQDHYKAFSVYQIDVDNIADKTIKEVTHEARSNN